MANIKEQRKKVEDEIKKLEGMGGSITGRAVKLRDSALSRFPVVFVLLSSFGLVATFYGFEKIIDGIPFFVEHPQMVLLSGLLALTITGTLYKKLS